LNLPNKLTLSRLALTAVFVVVMFAQFKFHETVALALFVAASLTDYYDGMIARRDKLITDFGILMDPLADKILTCSAFIAFVERQNDAGEPWMPAWMVVIIVARELAITGLRLLAASKKVVLAAERYGKHKTISQIVAIIAILVLAAHGEWGMIGGLFSFDLLGFGPWVGWFTELATWLTVVLTFFSGAIYLWRNRNIYLDDM
jgi:CDP-diacylglycerol---glycerol-3-phosphate 3-phosphatidyltransferase